MARGRGRGSSSRRVVLKNKKLEVGGYGVVDWRSRVLLFRVAWVGRGEFAARNSRCVVGEEQIKVLMAARSFFPAGGQVEPRVDFTIHDATHFFFFFCGLELFGAFAGRTRVDKSCIDTSPPGAAPHTGSEESADRIIFLFSLPVLFDVGSEEDS